MVPLSAIDVVNLRGLSRRPLHRPAAEDVKVEVWDRLPAVGAVIDDDAVTGLDETKQAGRRGGSGKKGS